MNELYELEQSEVVRQLWRDLNVRREEIVVKDLEIEVLRNENLLLKKREETLLRQVKDLRNAISEAAAFLLRKSHKQEER